jgi:catechol 2,3-dioxygenase-like lactoylglutathione lyase family enzyme
MVAGACAHAAGAAGTTREAACRDHRHACFSLSVAGVDRSTAFYREFGFEVVFDREVEGDYVEVMTGVPDAHVRTTHLTGFGHNLELPGAGRRVRIGRLTKKGA